ncbi:hypothetical protein ABZP36_027304 [Zizania latifolia]
MGKNSISSCFSPLLDFIPSPPKKPKRVTYEVVFQVMLTDPAYGWSVPVNLQLKFPDGTVHQRKENLQEKLRLQWLELRVGEVEAQQGQTGEIEISMFEYDGGQWKRGLVIKGIKIIPKQRFCALEEDKGTTKYWVDERTRHNCFMLFPRSLSITWSENPEYWTWSRLEDESIDAKNQIEVAYLEAVCWLLIRGKLELSYLTPGVTYEVVFQVMLTDDASGWKVPVGVRLYFPDGTVQQHEEYLKEKPRRQWLELKVGEVIAQQGQTGEIEISMFRLGGSWKSGLFIKGIKIAPKQRSSEKLTMEKRQEASRTGEGHSNEVGISTAFSNSNQAQSNRALAPHMFQAIVADEKTTTASALEDQIYTGIILAGKTKKYWVDERRHNCFILFPRGLSITWSENPECWTWDTLEEESIDANNQIEVAFLVGVSSLEIHGRLELSYLTPGVTYEVVFQVMLTDDAYGWSVPVDLQLKFPDGTVHQHKENLQEKLRGEWLELKVGKKYWVDRRTRHNCFMLFPRGLSITSSENPKYWTWHPLKEESSDADTQIEVASLNNLCWLEIRGRLELSDLTPGVTYEVVFQVMLTDPAYRWSVPVNLQLKFPDGTVHQHQENLQVKLRWWWLALKVGEVKAQQGQTGEIDISLFEESSRQQASLTDMLQAIVANENITASAQENQIYTGIFLAGKTKYWVDRRTGHNCFILFPRGLSITLSENPKYWTWYPLKEESDADTQIEVASLNNFCWLEIHGRLQLSYLTPGVTYEVVFQVILTDPAYRWYVPVNLQLKFPDGTVHQHQENLHVKLRWWWLALKVGEVKAQQGQTGEVEISMFEYGGQWKRGLVIKGIKILPKQGYAFL